MATEQEVERVIGELLRRIGDADAATRALLPSQRLIEIRCPDLEMARFAQWRSGSIQFIDEPLGQDADIRIVVGSDDLVAIASGQRSFAQAYASKRLRIDASMTDLLRLRTVL